MNDECVRWVELMIRGLRAWNVRLDVDLDRAALHCGELRVEMRWIDIDTSRCNTTDILLSLPFPLLTRRYGLYYLPYE